MSVLNAAASDAIGRFFERLLELHAGGAVTTESAVDYLMRTIDAVDSQDPAALEGLRATLDDAWREDDA